MTRTTQGEAVEAAIAKVPRYLAGADGDDSEEITALIYVWMAGTTTYQDGRGTIVTEPTGQHPEKVVEAARTDPAAWEACRMLVAGLAEHNDPIPPALLDFTAKGMRDQWPKPSRARLRHKNLARDLRIANAVQMLNKAGIQLYQNEATPDALSACSIVAEHVDLSYSAVKSIWTAVGPHVIESKERGIYYFRTRPCKLRMW